MGGVTCHGQLRLPGACHPGAHRPRSARAHRLTALTVISEMRATADTQWRQTRGQRTGAGRRSDCRMEIDATGAAVTSPAGYRIWPGAADRTGGTPA